MRTRFGIAAIIVLCLLAGAVWAAELSPPTVNMLHFQRKPAEPPLQVGNDSIASLAPPGWTVTDVLACQLDGEGSREVAVLVCRPGAVTQGTSKVLIVREDNISGPALAEFEFPGTAPLGDENDKIPSAFFTDDLNGDGLQELFVRTRLLQGANMWIFTNMIKWQGGAPIHAGRFGGESPGGLYFLDIRESTPGREVILLHPIWSEGVPHQGPHIYQAIVFGWANGYYVRIHEFTTTTMYREPDPAFDNMRRYLWQR